MNTYWDAVDRICTKIAANIRDDFGTIKLCLVGGAAMYHHTQARVSEDIEGFFNCRGIPLSDNLIEPFLDDENKERLLYYDTNYTNVLGLMHPDVADDFDAEFITSIGPLQIVVLKPVDLAVSKIARYIEKDADDINILIRHGLINEKEFRERAEEALLYYIGRPEPVQVNIDNVCELIREFNESRSGGKASISDM